MSTKAKPAKPLDPEDRRPVRRHEIGAILAAHLKQFYEGALGPRLVYEERYLRRVEQKVDALDGLVEEVEELTEAVRSTRSALSEAVRRLDRERVERTTELDGKAERARVDRALLRSKLDRMEEQLDAIAGWAGKSPAKRFVSNPGGTP